MTLQGALSGAVSKKDIIFFADTPRFAVRAILGGIYLTFATGLAGVVGNVAESLAPGHGLGALVFGMTFGLGLFIILVLNAELATSNMMYMGYAANAQVSSWARGIGVVLATTFFNLVGALIVGALIGYSAKFSDFDSSHFVATVVTGKLEKDALRTFIEANGANFVVNMGIIASLVMKDWVSKFFAVISIISIFVVLGLEHVIANFSLFSLAGFAGLFHGTLPDGFTAGAIATNWTFAFLGNLVGGAVIGVVYGWLNRGDEAYRD